jgi:predicted TIM-barrel fold metal-dependent hydrolase
MDRMDEFIESYGWQVPDLTLKPSEYFRRQCWVSFDPGEKTAALLGDRIGRHTMIWASDFPHSDAKYPGVVDELMEHAEAMEPATRAGFVGLNALALYGLELPKSAFAPASTGPTRERGPA